MTSQKCVSHPSLVLYVFPTPPIKLELGLQIGWRLLIATHLNQSNYRANEHQLSPGFVVSFTSLSKLCKKCWAETILLNQTGMFWLFFIQFNLQGHILSTGWTCSNLWGIVDYSCLLAEEYFQYPVVNLNCAVSREKYRCGWLNQKLTSEVPCVGKCWIPSGEVLSRCPGYSRNMTHMCSLPVLPSIGMCIQLNSNEVWFSWPPWVTTAAFVPPRWCGHSFSCIRGLRSRPLQIHKFLSMGFFSNLVQLV